jgi:hypothetical protein
VLAGGGGGVKVASAAKKHGLLVRFLSCFMYLRVNISSLGRYYSVVKDA